MGDNYFQGSSMSYDYECSNFPEEVFPKDSK